VHTIGVDLGGTKCLGLVVDADGAVVAEHRVPTPREPGKVLDALTAVVGRLRADVPDVVGIGVGVPGLVDDDGVLRMAPNLVGVDCLPVRAGLLERLDPPVAAIHVDNDATCATWGERELGAGRKQDDVVLVTLGTGIGGGIIMRGRLVRGAHGYAGEIGHMVVDPDGPPCPCGQRGCWERYASGSGLGRLAREAAHAGRARRMVALAGGDAEDVRGEHVTAALAEGDPDAAAVMERFAWWLALGLANLANILDPRVFVLAGGLVEAGDVLLGPARRAFAGLVEGARHRGDLEIVPAALGEHAGAIGAALLARDAVDGTSST
jgi:glucokinase